MIDYDDFADWLEGSYPGLYEDWCNDDSDWVMNAYEFMKRKDMNVVREWVNLRYDKHTVINR